MLATEELRLTAGGYFFFLKGYKSCFIYKLQLLRRLIVTMQRHFFFSPVEPNESFKVNDSTEVRSENGDFSRGGS